MPHLSLGDAKIHYERHGHGEPLILITGLGGDLRFWKRYVPLLSRDHEVIVFDNRGAGATTLQDDEFTVEMLADDVASILRDCGHQKAHVLGWSMGGNVAQEVAIKYPEMTHSLVLMSTYTKRPERSSYAIDTMIKTTDEGASYETLMALMQSWCLTDAAFVGKRQAARNKEALEAAATELIKGFRAQKLALDGFDSTGRLHLIRCPTLIMHGTDDAMVPPRYGERLARGIPSSELIYVEEAGHIIPAEQCCHHIIGFLKRNPF